jgi:alpha-ketoglutaric semialdehyde dehydrogenase
VDIRGYSWVAGAAAGDGETFQATNQATGAVLGPDFHSAGAAEVALACKAAADAAPALASDRERRAQLLEAIGEEIMALGDPLLARASAESGLPLARLTGERGRTVGQLKLFAAEVRDGGWLGVRIDPAMPDRAPLPRPDLRMRKQFPAGLFGRGRGHGGGAGGGMPGGGQGSPGASRNL